MKREQDFGYEYITALCGAIEEFTKDEEASNQKVFIYRGSDLRYALERSLYFTYADDSLLFDIYKGWKTANLSDKVEVRDTLQKKLLLYMCHLPEEKILVRQPEIQGRIKVIIKLVVRLIINGLLIDKSIFYLRKKINGRIQREIKIDVLFFVINERFVRFMRPIFDKLSRSKAYITYDQVTEKYLEAEKIPYLKISHFLDKITRWAKPDTWLKRFYLLGYYDILYDTLKRVRPKKLVLVEGNVAAYEIANQICKKLDIECICLQQGWSPIVHNGFKNMTFSKMLVWGDGFGKDLKPWNPDQSFVTTGNFTVETRALKNLNKISTVGLFFHGVSFIVNQKTTEDFLIFTKELIKVCPNLNIIIREHPAYKISPDLKTELLESGKVKFMSGPEYSLEQVMELSDLNIAVYSTTPLESIAAGILPILMNVTSVPHFFPDIGKMGAGIEVKSVDDALKIMEVLVDNPESIKKFKEPMEKFKKEYFAYNQEMALENIIKEITE